LLLVGVSAARAGNGNGELPPPSQTTEKPALYDRVSVWQYTIDGDNSYQQNGNKQSLLTMNSLLAGKAWLVHTAIRSAEYAVTLRFLEPLAQPVAGVTQKLAGLFWQGGWVTAGLAIVAFSALLSWVSRRRARAYGLLACTVLILMSSTWLAERADVLIRDGFSSGAGVAEIGIGAVADALAASRATGSPAGGGGRAQQLVRAGGVALWQTLVLQPWINLEFGAEETAKFYSIEDIPGGSFLILSPGDRQQQYYQQTYQQRQERFSWWGEDYTVRRLVLSIVGFAAAVLAVVPLLLLSGGLLFYQLLFVLLLVLAPVWLLLALWWPNSAAWALRRLFLRGLGAVVLPVVLGLLLAVMMFLSVVVAELTTRWGWMFGTLVQATLGLVVYRYRYEWLELFASRHHRPRKEGETRSDAWFSSVRSRWSMTMPERGVVWRQSEMALIQTPAADWSYPSESVLSPGQPPPLFREHNLADPKTAWEIIDQPDEPDASPLTDFQTNIQRVHAELTHSSRPDTQGTELRPGGTSLRNPKTGVQEPLFGRRVQSGDTGLPKR
jgi:hypothetical protein